MGQFLNASRKVFDAMEAGDWEKVKELVATTSWTRVDLEKKHGVDHSNIWYFCSNDDFKIIENILLLR